MSSEQDDQQRRGCCSSLAGFFSVLSESQHTSMPRLDKKVSDIHNYVCVCLSLLHWLSYSFLFLGKINELKEEVRRQKELKETYKARLERTQDYLRYCLEVAKENGFLHHISGDQESTLPTQTDHQRPSLQAVDVVPSDPRLAAVMDQAKLNGWYVEPEEVSAVVSSSRTKLFLQQLKLTIFAFVVVMNATKNDQPTLIINEF